MFLDVLLPGDLAPGDRVYIQSAGAYTTAYASRFNGFEIPRAHLVGPPPLTLVAPPADAWRPPARTTRRRRAPAYRGA
jgi:hypothetical protein